MPDFPSLSPDFLDRLLDVGWSAVVSVRVACMTYARGP